MYIFGGQYHLEFPYFFNELYELDLKKNYSSLIKTSGILLKFIIKII
jgi:hypothetical protein